LWLDAIRRLGWRQLGKNVRSTEKPPTILTFVSEDYIPVGLNWLNRIRALRPEAEVQVIALDRATMEAFPPDVVKYAPARKPRLSALWTHRIDVLCDLLARGHDVVHSDADAVWVRDPLPYIQSCKAEMVFSQGTIWPPDVHARHGVVLCCGLFYLQSSPAVRGFMRKARRRVQNDKDDQKSINRMIDENGVRWKITDPYSIPYGDATFTASRQPILSEVNTGPTVAVLPHRLFPRLVDELTPDVMVAHPLSGKTCAAKIEVLSRLGLWDEGQS